MSGGVDSSTAAGLLVEAGHEVIGLAMKTHGLEPRGNRACCTPDDMRDARKVADILNIPFYVLPYEDVFREAVMLPFAQAYREGRTPNPCVECNDKVKFKPLLQRAKLLGADFLATGHYAQISSIDGLPCLKRGLDPRKDQSYFLYRLGVDQLGQLLFPVGGMHKDEVREHARRLGLPIAEKTESQEICFVGDEGYAATVEKIAGVGGKPGKIFDENGKVLGQHDGIHHFTLGQRRGLGIATAAPVYVTHIDAESGAVHVGGREQLQCESVEVEGVKWTTGTAPEPDQLVQVQQRYRETGHPAFVEVLEGDKIKLHFPSPTPRGAPGQAAVIYHNDTVLGGGTLMRVPSRSRLPVLLDNGLRA